MADLSKGDFHSLAREVFAYQYRKIPAYRRLCDARGASPERLGSWRAIPAVPTLAFKSLALHTAPAREVFRSSGTRSGDRSVHHHPFPDLYRHAIDCSFPRFCLPQLRQPPVLALVPSRQQAPDSSLSFMVDHVISRFAASDSIVAFGTGGVEAASASSWLVARQRDQRPALVMGTVLSLVQLLRSLKDQDLRLSLPSGSVLFETGGYKGRRQQLSRAELLQGVEEILGIPASQVVAEYGMTELSSQCYGANFVGEDPELLVCPHWVRVRTLDPATLEDTAPGCGGLISVTDLANMGSAVHVLTDDLGVLEGEGFRLEGRAPSSELRGCSLTAEELASPDR